MGELYDMYAKGYPPIIELVAINTIKTIATRFSLDDLRLHRKLVENELHQAVHAKLSGGASVSDQPL